MSAHLTGEDSEILLEHLPALLHQLPPESTSFYDHTELQSFKKQV